ncbi:hypothetical protein [Thioclava sp. GXIMD2076]|uniref:hypothetical protein n=1 Tax=Thioclava sp. GXIMD2076 TaxID=3131931 RepID=UPI0030CAAD7F
MKTLIAMVIASISVAVTAQAETARADLVDAQGQALASVTVADLAPEDGSVRLMLATIELTKGDHFGAGVELASTSSCGSAQGMLLIPQADLVAQGEHPALPMPALGRQKAEFILADTDVRSAFLARKTRAISLRQDGVQLACAMFEPVSDGPDSASTDL